MELRIQFPNRRQMMHARVVRTERTTPHFVTVTKAPGASWDGLLDDVGRVVLAHVGA